MDSEIGFILTATMGAITQEVVHWYNLRGRFGQEKVEDLTKSFDYWIVTVLMTVCSGVGAWLVFGEREVTRDIQFYLGASFPLIFKKAVVTMNKKDQTNLGSSNLSTYFELF